MRVSDILYDIRDAQKAILDMKDQSDFLRASLYGRAIRYDVDKVQTTPTDIMSDRLAEVCDHDARICKRQKKLDRRKNIMREQLNRLDDPDQARILDLYYLTISDRGCLYSWADVARIVGKSQRTIFRQALDAEKNLNDILYVC